MSQRDRTPAKIDREFEGFPPYLGSIHDVLYVTRGRLALSDLGPLTLDEWLACVEIDGELALDEVYEQYEIHREETQRWRVRGRCRWMGAPTEREEHLQFARASIHFVHDGEFRGGPPSRKHEAIRSKLSDDPAIEEWLALVERDRWLEPDLASGEPGRVNWVGREGQVKHVFRYMPSSVWMHRSGGRLEPDGHVRARRALLDRLAGRLRCEVWDGVGRM
jgi:hypothetical protein